MGTDHYGALDNPATLLHPRQPTTTHNTPAKPPWALPSTRQSFTIHPRPSPPTYIPAPKALVSCASILARCAHNLLRSTCTFYGDSLNILDILHSTSFHTLRVAPFLIRSTLGPCQLHNQLFWSSLLLLCPDIRFESDSTSSLYTIFHYYILIKGQAGIERVVC